MIALHEAEVVSRFDHLHARFKREVDGDDVRLHGLLSVLPPLRGARVLDLGCGKGRFAAHLAREGARVVGLDVSGAMLAEAQGIDRVRGSARRLPFGAATFDAAVAVEVFEHMAAVDPALDELQRVLRPGGVLAVVDKNAGSWNAQRPWLPNLALKCLDERRGRWMYPHRGPVRERWFWPRTLRHALRRRFVDCRVRHLLSPAETRHALFRCVPAARLFVLWSARMPGGQG